MSVGLIEGQYQALNKRNISEETCRKFHYQVGTHANRNCHIANYYNRNLDVVAQKLRFSNKDFKLYCKYIIPRKAPIKQFS